MKIEELRKKYPEFVYKGYEYKLQRGDLELSFTFEIAPDIKFEPKVVIKNVSYADIARIGEGSLNNMVFHVGLAEMPSYWKATASPRIVIKAGYVSEAQINWWHDLFMRGMGQYFFQNNLDFTKLDFLTIISLGGRAYPTHKGSIIKHPHLVKHSMFNKMFNKKRKNLNGKTLIPVGGGKDAIVTLELLKKLLHRTFVLNLKGEHKTILKIAGEKNPIIVERTIDPKLLELNRKGFLNGHTPFSAYLAFLTTLCAALFGYKYIAFSNERSSNEGNMRYRGKVINHQYSKSFEFEKKFRWYSAKYLASELEYFSFLRPLYELQIAKIFAHYPKYFGVFLSCNEAHKTKSGTEKPTGTWCGRCAKCLFVWLIFRPFIKEEQLIKIFKKNLLKDKKLKPLLDELTGKKKFKPFECVGTIRESRAALSLRVDPILSLWNKRHFLPPAFSKILKTAKGC